MHKPVLTPREVSIVKCAGEGKTDREIASTLRVKIKTVHSHWSRIRIKLNATTRANCVACAIADGYLEAEEVCQAAS
jgi:DNA-binding NarL/FixJ family response regulator